MTPGESQRVLEELAASNRFVVQRTSDASRASFRIGAAGQTGEAREPLLFATQALVEREQRIRFCVAEQGDAEVFSVVPTRERDAFGAGHDVLGEDGVPIARLEKDYRRSTLRDFWSVTDAATRELFRAREANLGLAIARRALDVLPLGGAPAPYGFVLERAADEVGRHARAEGRRPDRWLLELARDWPVDRRVVLAWAVAVIVVRRL